MVRATRSRNWCITLNNPAGSNDAECWETCKSMLSESCFSYAVGQLERGENGTLHLQAYVQCAFGKAMHTVRNVFAGRAHCAVRQGTHEQARTYVTKERTRVNVDYFLERGEPRLEQGSRVDLMAVKADIDNGMCLEDLWDNHFSAMLRYGKNLEKYHRRKQYGRVRDVKVLSRSVSNSTLLTSQ